MADDELEEDTTGNGIAIKFEEFFHGQMDQITADELLGQYEPNNHFLVRERIITKSSVKPDEQFCISLHTRQDGLAKKVHFRIRQSYDLWVIGGLVFHSLAELVTYYTQVEILTGARLEHPIPPKHRCPAKRSVMAIVTYTKSPGTDELSLTAGDVCFVEHTNKDGWMWATHVKTKQSGWICNVIVEDLNSPNYDPELESCEFYHPSHRDERIEELKGRSTGTYFLRPSAKSPNTSVLCVNCTGAIKKFEIEKGSGGRKFLLSGRAFDTIDDIIKRYSQTFIDKENAVMLQEPLLRRSHAASNLPQDDIYAENRLSSMQTREGHLTSELHCLFPKRRSRSQRNWKRQRCTLHRRDADNYEVLIAPVAEPGRRKPKGLIALEFAHLYPVCQGAYDRPHCLQLVIFNEASISSTPPDVYVLAADSPQVLADWLAALKPVCKCSKVCNQTKYRGGGVRHISTLEVSVKRVHNLSVSCKTAFVTVHFNGVTVAKTRSNRREQDDDFVINWDEQFHFDFFPECVQSLSLHLSRSKAAKSTKVVKHDVPVSELSLGRTADLKLPAGPDKVQLCFSVRRVGHAVLQASKDYVPIRDIVLGTESSSDCLRALGEVCQSEDLTYLARAIYKVFAYHNLGADLLTSLLLNDIQSLSEESEGVLFRTTTIGTAALEVYLITEEPLQFVRHCLGDMVQEIVRANASLELKVDRLLHSSGELSDQEEAEAVAARNAARLNDLLNACMRRTLQHCQAGGCPSTLHRVSVACQQETSHRFPQATARVLSAFFFLRLFCPALTTKFRQVFGPQLHQDASPQVMRSLQLAAKALQLFANQSSAFREACMERVRPFVCENGDLFRQLNACLTAASGSPASPRPVTVSSDSEVAASSSASAASAAASASGSASSLATAASAGPNCQNISLTFELASLHDFCARHLKELSNLQARSRSQSLKKLISATEFLSGKLAKVTD